MNSVFDGVTFRLHGMVFAVDALKVREVVGGAEWLPEGDDQSSIQTRGRVMPVVDLRQLFGFDSLEKGAMNSFIAVQVPGEGPGQLAALWVDALLNMIHILPGGLKAAPGSVGEIPARFFQAVLEQDGETIYVIQTDEIVREDFSGDKQLAKAAS
jgi:purine-binding chemotaxis protein CheW